MKNIQRMQVGNIIFRCTGEVGLMLLCLGSEKMCEDRAVF